MAAPIPLSPEEVTTIQEVPKPTDIVTEVEPKLEAVPEAVAEVEQPETQVETQKEIQEEIQEERKILESLTSVDRLQITRRLHVRGALFLRGKKNRFFVRTPDQHLVYTIEEENSWWVGYFFYGLRPLQLRVTNCLGEEVLRIFRPYAFTTRILPCQLQRLQVFVPPGIRVGSIQQVWSAVKPQYVVRNADGDDVFWINGPRFTISCFHDVHFYIERPDGTQVGATCKRWEGLVHALFLAPVMDRFGLSFEKNLKEEEKALLLAASILLDYMYYDI